MDKWKKPFAPKKFFHWKKEFSKYFDKSKVWCYNFQKKGHYAKEWREKKNNKRRFHASTIVEDETPQKNAPGENDTRRE